jgi:hypothetical protein
MGFLFGGLGGLFFATALKLVGGGGDRRVPQGHSSPSAGGSALDIVRGALADRVGGMAALVVLSVIIFGVAFGLFMWRTGWRTMVARHARLASIAVEARQFTPVFPPKGK